MTPTDPVSRAAADVAAALVALRVAEARVASPSTVRLAVKVTRALFAAADALRSLGGNPDAPEIEAEVRGHLAGQPKA